jgi:hypothetical protein
MRDAINKDYVANLVVANIQHCQCPIAEGEVSANVGRGYSGYLRALGEEGREHNDPRYAKAFPAEVSH